MGSCCGVLDGGDVEMTNGAEAAVGAVDGPPVDGSAPVSVRTLAHPALSATAAATRTARRAAGNVPVGVARRRLCSSHPIVLMPQVVHERYRLSEDKKGSGRRASDPGAVQDSGPCIPWKPADPFGIRSTR